MSKSYLITRCSGLYQPFPSFCRPLNSGSEDYCGPIPQSFVQGYICVKAPFLPELSTVELKGLGSGYKTVNSIKTAKTKRRHDTTANIQQQQIFPRFLRFAVHGIEGIMTDHIWTEIDFDKCVVYQYGKQ